MRVEGKKERTNEETKERTNEPEAWGTNSISTIPARKLYLPVDCKAYLRARLLIRSSSSSS